MKRTVGLVAVFLLILTVCANVSAEGQKAPDYIMEGFDGENTERNWETNLFFSRMEEKTGISFQFREYTKYSSWQERISQLAEKENLPDVLFKAELNQGEVRDLYEAGVLIDLKPYLEENAPDLWKILQENEDIMKAVSMPDGAIPALPNITPLQNNDAMWINTGWLARLGLETPVDAESLKNVLKAFREKDPNANGRTDEIPLTFVGMWELRFLGHAFGIIDNDYYVSVHDGKVGTALTTENNRAFLSWLHELWEEKLLDHNGFSMADSMRQITDEKASIPYGVILSSSPLTVVPSAALKNYSLLMPMKYNGKQVYRDLGGDLIRGTFAITSRCASPEKLVNWVNYLYTEEGSRMAQFGLEGEDYAFRDDGKWEWMEDLNTVARVVLTNRTIASGSSIPGISSAEFQVQYSDEEAAGDIAELLELKKTAVEPYPPVTMSKEDEEAVARIQKDLSPYAETTMAQFVTGDIPLNDEQWQIFCKKAEDLGLNEMIDIFQKYIQ